MQIEREVFMIYKQEYYENIAENIIGKFNTRGIEGYYCTDREEANAKAKRFLTPGCTISWGGSETLLEKGDVWQDRDLRCLFYEFQCHHIGWRAC